MTVLPAAVVRLWSVKAVICRLGHIVLIVDRTRRVVAVRKRMRPCICACDHGSSRKAANDGASHLIVDPDKRLVIHHARGEADVVATRFISEGSISLDPPGIELQVRDLIP
jgi:hypothetical protein